MIVVVLGCEECLYNCGSKLTVGVTVPQATIAAISKGHHGPISEKDSSVGAAAGNLLDCTRKSSHIIDSQFK